MWRHVEVAALVTGLFALAMYLAGREPPARTGVGPGPVCALPPRTCTGGSHCSDLVEVPMAGPGYLDIRLASEESPATSTSYLRRDLMMLVRYAAAKVACKTHDWTTGNGGPIALGDMSEIDGSTPGTQWGSPRHPVNTHVGGTAIDIAYFQRGTLDNQLRPICRHVSAYGDEMYRCIAEPDRLDAWRTALLIGAFLEDPHIRVIGIDGGAARAILSAFDELCRTDWIDAATCTQRRRIQYEVRDEGRGWFRGHHNHFHVAIR